MEKQFFSPFVSLLKLRTSSSLLVNSIGIIFSAFVCKMEEKVFGFPSLPFQEGYVNWLGPCQIAQIQIFQPRYHLIVTFVRLDRNITESEQHTKSYDKFPSEKWKNFLSTGSSLSSFLRFDQPSKTKRLLKNNNNILRSRCNFR